MSPANLGRENLFIFRAAVMGAEISLLSARDETLLSTVTQLGQVFDIVPLLIYFLIPLKYTFF